jgi:hypothetical protein
MKRRDVLKAATGAAVALSALPLRWVTAAEEKKPKLLFFTRSVGFEHSAVRRDKGQLSHAEKVLTEMGKRAGFEVECSKDGSVFDGDLDLYNAVAFYTCGDLTQPDQYNTPPMTPQGKQKLLAAIAGGKGFSGFHSAADTFHSPAPNKQGATELDPYVAMLGGEFVSHGVQQEASMIIASRFPGAGDIGCSEGISFTEEWYALKNFAKDLHVVLVQETRFMKGACYQRPDFPATWARMHGKGRVFYTSLGHREDVWTNPFFQAISLGGIGWALGRGNPNVAPNIDKVTPQANQLKN